MITMVNTFVLPELEKFRGSDQSVFSATNYAPSDRASVPKRERSRANGVGNLDGEQHDDAQDRAALTNAVKELQRELSHVRRELSTIRRG